VPYKPKNPCARPGCPELTSARFCPAHAKQDTREYERYRRDPAINKRYGRAWRRIRDRYIAAHPLCEKCAAADRFIPAREVHHIIPLSAGGTHAEKKVMALCTPCHSGITLGENNKNRG